MEKIDTKAWAILNDEEKSSLSLSINYKKSTWQAGEIMEKAHYKYLEINARARYFFVMFTDYFKKTNNQLIPPNSEMVWDFKEFIRCTIEERLGYRATLKVIGRSSELNHKVAEQREKKLIEYMEWLRKHNDPLHRDLYDLIKEFDRWNKFRILPKAIQEPSAFKRRNKTRLIKHLKSRYRLDPILIDYLKSKKFKPGKKENRLYMALVTEEHVMGYEVIEIKNIAEVKRYISKELNLYLFDDKDDADDFGFLVEGYLASTKRTCKLGQDFWPRFREQIKKANNYNDINNIISRRKNLEEAFRNLDNINIQKKKTKSILEEYNGAEERLKSSNMWSL